MLSLSFDVKLFVHCDHSQISKKDKVFFAELNFMKHRLIDS